MCGCVGCACKWVWVGRGNARDGFFSSHLFMLPLALPLSPLCWVLFTPLLFGSPLCWSRRRWPTGVSHLLHSLFALLFLSWGTVIPFSSTGFCHTRRACFVRLLFFFFVHTEAVPFLSPTRRYQTPLGTRKKSVVCCWTSTLPRPSRSSTDGPSSSLFFLSMSAVIRPLF